MDKLPSELLIILFSYAPEEETVWNVYGNFPEWNVTVCHRFMSFRGVKRRPSSRVRWEHRINKRMDRFIEYLKRDD